MASVRPQQPAVPDRSGLVIPDELRIGPCQEVWAGADAEYGDLLAARGRYVRARAAYEADNSLTVQESCRLMPPGRPWSLTDPSAGQRLALLGLTTNDLPRLRRAAEAYPDNPRGTAR